MTMKTLTTLCFIYQRNKSIERLRHCLDHYDLHHAIFGDSLATSNNAGPSIDPYLWWGNDMDDYENSGDKDNDAAMLDTSPRSGDKRANPSRAGGKASRRREKPWRITSLTCWLWHWHWWPGWTKMLISSNLDSPGHWKSYCVRLLTLFLPYPIWARIRLFVRLSFFRLTQMPSLFFLGCQCVLGEATFA